VRVLASGETFTLTRDTGLIERNDVRIAHFSDVERVQIRTIHDSEGSDEHRLSIVLKSEEKLRIDQSTNAQDIAAVAEDLADMLGVEVTRKGRVQGIDGSRPLGRFGNVVFVLLLILGFFVVLILVASYLLA